MTEYLGPFQKPGTLRVLADLRPRPPNPDPNPLSPDPDWHPSPIFFWQGLYFAVIFAWFHLYDATNILTRQLNNKKIEKNNAKNVLGHWHQFLIVTLPSSSLFLPCELRTSKLLPVNPTLLHQHTQNEFLHKGGYVLGVRHKPNANLKLWSVRQPNIHFCTNMMIFLIRKILRNTLSTL